MASSTADYFSQSRPVVRPRQSSNLNPAAPTTPASPRTPLLGRSISGQFGSPCTPFRSEQEDYVVYELGARHLSAGFAGESRPRCVLPFTPEDGRRVGDFRSYDAEYERPRKKLRKEEDWGAEHELYRTDIRSLDLDLVEDKLERGMRKVHADFLQLPNKPLKAVLAIPTLLPMPLVEIALKVLFNHYAQPPSVMLLTTPVLACVGAGLRNALVVDVGWEETVVTAVGEYKEVHQRRSVRAGKLLTREMAKVLQREANSQKESANEAKLSNEDGEVSFEYAEEVTRRMGWCRPRKSQAPDNGDEAKLVKIPHPTANKNHHESLSLFFARLCEPAETALLSPTRPSNSKPDDHETPLPELLYTTLLALPLDLRALCLSRITFTGGVSALPGLKHRLLQELAHLVDSRGWDPVASYGSAAKQQSRVLAERSANIAAYQTQQQQRRERPPEDLKREQLEAMPVHERPHDDERDSLTARVERRWEVGQRDVVKGVVRGVETLGAWVGASLVVGLRVKGVVEVEREEFLRHGLKDDGSL